MSIGKSKKIGALAALTALMLSGSALAGTASLQLATDAPVTTSPAGMKVVRDATTGELRAPTAAEAKAMLEQDMAAIKANGKAGVGMLTGTDAPQQKVVESGAVMLELAEDTMVYSVVKRAADGSLNMQCVTGADAAKKLLHSKSPATKQEHKHDK
ncbi:MAG: hypothetical protein RL748_2089 [Pseudomonadota bacterium]|jgi:hypothetical protein